MKNVNKKLLIVTIVALVLAVSCVVGTFAYLAMKTESITNVFTSGNVKITLTETPDLNLKMVPGETITKDPVVTVLGDSETSWVFVKITKSTDLDTYIEYSVATGWTEVEAGVWGREVTASAEDQAFQVLTNNTVTVKSGLTSAQMEAVTEGEADVSLTLTAYAIQKDGFETLADAWTEAKKLG